MRREIETKFYEFTQNNSGGHFDVDENVCHRVVIEAINADHARSIFEPMIEDQNSSCPCCGDRWCSYSPDEIDTEQYREKGLSVGVYSHYENPEKRWFDLYGNFPIIEEPKWVKKSYAKEFEGKIYFETIEQYLQYLANTYGWTTPDCRIHYLDGTKKEIFKKEIQDGK